MTTKNKVIPFEKSLASHSKAEFWLTEKNGCEPKDVSEWSLKNIGPNATPTNNAWCPFCKKKTEGKLKAYLESIYSISCQQTFYFCVNPKTNKKLPLDFWTFGFLFRR